MKEKGLLPADPDNFPDDGGKSSSLLPGNPGHDALKSEQATKFIQLFCWGFGVGLSLIAPMLLIKLHNTLLTLLLTTGVSVIIFSGRWRGNPVHRAC
jgi:hypothetical protein